MEGRALAASRSAVNASPELAMRSSHEWAPAGDAAQSRPRVDLWLGGRPHQAALVLQGDRPAESFDYVAQWAKGDEPPRVMSPDVIGLSFWRDRSTLRRCGLAPVKVVAARLDARPDLLGLRFQPPHEPTWTYGLREPVPVEIASIPGLSHSLPARVTDLGPYEGCFELIAARSAWLVGALLSLRESAGRPAVDGGIRVQITNRDASGRYWFRVADQASVARAALLLLRWSVRFSPADLIAYTGSRQRGDRGLWVQVVDDPEVLSDALRIRLLANQSFGRLSNVDDAWSVLDRLDAHAVNFVCYTGARAVGTGRVVLNGGDRTLSEIEGEVGLPDWLWQRGFAEVSRFAIHPQFYGSGVTVALFQEVARIALTVHCRYLVLDCIEKLVPAYQKVGGKLIGIRKRHPYSDEIVHVMVIDILEGLSSLRGNVLYWGAVFGPVVGQFHALGALDHYLSQFSVGQHLSYRAKLALGRLASLAKNLARS